jgi:hypothetical protein
MPAAQPIADPIEHDTKPTPERRKHNRIIREEVQNVDESGAVSWPFRVVDTLAIMEGNGTITAEQRKAGEDFRLLFRRAQLEALRCCDLAKPRVDNGVAPVLPASVEYARRDVQAVLDAVGKPADSCLWHIVGLEISIDAWRTQRWWNGRMLNPHAAKGILIAALGALASYFADQRRERRAA